MNGEQTFDATRYYISGLDLAVLQDVGIPLATYPWGTVTGQLYLDSNRDGVANRHEPRLAGWTVYADLNYNGVADTGEPTAVTDSSGNYTLQGLHPGYVLVRVSGNDGGLQTSSMGRLLVTVLPGMVTGPISFGWFNGDLAGRVSETDYPSAGGARTNVIGSRRVKNRRDYPNRLARRF